MSYLRFSCQCGKKWKKRFPHGQDPVAQCWHCYTNVVAESFEELEFYCDECDSDWCKYWPKDTDNAPVSQCKDCEKEVVATTYEYLEFLCERCRRRWDAYLHEEDDPLDDCPHCHTEVLATGYQRLPFHCEDCDETWDTYLHEEDDPLDECPRCHSEVLAKGYQRLSFHCEDCDEMWDDYWPASSSDDRVSECEGCGVLVVAWSYEYRMFACGDCQHRWWKTVPKHRRFCYCIGQCGQRLKTIPRNKEYGIGEHVCKCGNTFYGRTQATVSSPCYHCGRGCIPLIIPGKLMLRRKSNHTHRCELCKGCGDCVNFHRMIHTSEVLQR